MSDLVRLATLGLGLMTIVPLSGCKAKAAPLPLDHLNAAQMRGHGIFQARCVVCHNDRVDEPRNGPSMVGIFKKPSLPSGAAATDERVTASVRHGRNMMPAAGADLDDQDIQDLLAYLHTL